jgi:hypothetical protein
MGVIDHPSVIGDVAWTAFDYIEASIGWRGHWQKSTFHKQGIVLGKVARLAQEYAAFTTQSAIIFYARPRCGHFFISSYPITLNVQEQTGNRPG